MEQWKAIADFEGLYEVSDLGRVRSLPRNGTHVNRVHVLKPAINKDGYRRVVLSQNDVQTNHKIARLVALAFNPNPLNLPEVDHVDTNKLNDCSSNLEWVTKPENIQRAYDNGLMNDFIGAQGSQHHMAKLTDAKVQQIRRLYKGRNKGPSQYALGKQFGISQTMVGFIVRGENWAHLKRPPQPSIAVATAGRNSQRKMGEKIYA